MDQLRKDLNSDIRMMLKEKPDLLNEVHTSDAVLEADDVDLGLAEALQMMEPCGKDNEVPVFVIRNAEVRGWRFLKDDDKMARFSLVTAEGRSIDSVIFRNAAEAYEAVTEGRVDIYCNIEINTWRDVRKAQVIAREILPAGTE
jgi:single-stranded DNA-specific DHH superfamily exonuclease